MSDELSINDIFDRPGGGISRKSALDADIAAICAVLGTPQSSYWNNHGRGQGNGVSVVEIPPRTDALQQVAHYELFAQDCKRLLSAGYDIQLANTRRSDGWAVYYAKPAELPAEFFYFERPLGTAQEILRRWGGASSEAWLRARQNNRRAITFPAGEPDRAELEHELKVLENAGWLVENCEEDAGW